jgi:hypothetical protein
VRGGFFARTVRSVGIMTARNDFRIIDSSLLAFARAALCPAHTLM